MGRYLPAPPDYASPPPLWGSEQHVQRLFAGTPIELAFARGYNPWRFDSAEAWVAFMETNYGPTLKARERLGAEGRWEDCRAEIVEMAERAQRVKRRPPADERRIPGHHRSPCRLARARTRRPTPPPPRLPPPAGAMPEIVWVGGGGWAASSVVAFRQMTRASM